MSSARPPLGSHPRHDRQEAESPTAEPGDATQPTVTVSRSLTPSTPPSSPSLRVLEDDELIAHRYRVRGLLGRGGMGEVYEVEDCELRERVALKVLRRELAEKPGALEQLKREIALARKVSHPHVCRIFDVGYHQRSRAGATERIAFLTMELLQGESLSALLRRHGPLSPDEALPLVRQLAEGLGAAHEAGIIHRDLKSANVLLVPAPSGGVPRAVITDFGLARAAGDTSPEPAAPGTRLVGTPAYMAPEQLEGGPLTPATDLYALGILLFELLTGARPFTGEDGWSTALRRLHTPAPSPRQLRPGLDVRWEALVLRALEREPARRFQSARELLAALPRMAPAPGRRRGWRRTLPGLLTLGLFGLLSGNHFRVPSAGPLAVRAAPARPLVALILSGPEDTVGMDGLRFVLTQALRIELGMDEQLLFASESTLGTAMTALGLTEAEPLPPDALPRLRELLGCELVMRGTYSVEESAGPPVLRLELQLQRASTGARVASVTETGPLHEPLPLISRLSGRMREALGLQRAPAPGALGRILPSSLEALRLYAEGWRKYQQSDGGAARELFERGLALEPAPLHLRSGLALALITTGERDRALGVLQELLAHSDPLPLQQRLNLEALYHQYTPDLERVVALHERLFALRPEAAEFGLSLADAQLAADHEEAARTTLEGLRERFSAPIFAHRIEQLEAKVALKERDYPRAQAAAARAASLAETLKSWSSAGELRGLEATAWSRQGARERALEAIRHAVRLQQRAGNRRAEADATFSLAELLPAEDLRGRLQAAREAKALYAAQGHRIGECMALLIISDYEHSLGELRAALRSAREALPLCRGTRLIRLEMNQLFTTGQAWRSLGDLDAAEAAFREQLLRARASGSAVSTFLGLTGLAGVLLARGDLAQARQLADEAHELVQGLQRKDLEQSLAVDLLRARIAFEEGRLEEAARLTSEAVATVSGPAMPAVHHLQARIALAQGSVKEAHTALLQAGEPAMRLLQLGLQVQRARVRALRGTAGEHEAARRSLEALLTEARGLEWLEGQLEARLALGEVELASGRTAAGRTRLEALEREALERGWGLWARNAARLRASAGQGTAPAR